MTPSDLAAWRAHMGYSQRTAAESLGVTLAAYQAMERGADFATGKARNPDLRTALACAAIVAGVKPWAGEFEAPAAREDGR